MTPEPDRTPPVRLWRYQLALLFATLPLFVYTLWQSINQKKLRYLKQRTGFGYPAFPESGRKPVWLHAASVGEVLAAEPLLKELYQTNPDIPLLVTTMTPTGAEMAKQRLGNIAAHCYLPLDWRSATRRFIRSQTPRCALIMETELWPNLYTTCAEAGIAPVIVNGRISPRTLNTRSWIRQLYRTTLQQVNSVLARSEMDAERFLKLGALPDKVFVVGNIKFAAHPVETKPDKVNVPRPFVLAASTHEDEERRIASLWQGLKTGDRLLVIAPRHPKRSKAIIKQLQELSVPLAVRSQGDTIEAGTAVYLADTLGELAGFITAAELVIMGGSFVPVGGHNVLEPAMAGKAIIFGPHMHNFADEAEGLLTQKAAIQVENYTVLGRTVDLLMKDPEKCRTHGEHAREFMQENQGIARRYLAKIAEHCPEAGIKAEAKPDSIVP